MRSRGRILASTSTYNRSHRAGAGSLPQSTTAASLTRSLLHCFRPTLIMSMSPRMRVLGVSDLELAQTQGESGVILKLLPHCAEYL